MAYIGIDPGRTGAIALLSDLGELLEVVDTPLVDKKISEVLFASELVRLAIDTGYRGVIAVEVVHSMPGEGVRSSFSFGASAGIARGCAAMLATTSSRWSLARPSPQEWQRHHGLIGKPDKKEAARALALDLWPGKADMFKFKTKDGRADAALIALWAKESSTP